MPPTEVPPAVTSDDVTLIRLAALLALDAAGIAAARQLADRIPADTPLRRQVETTIQIAESLHNAAPAAGTTPAPTSPSAAAPSAAGSHWRAALIFVALAVGGAAGYRFWPSGTKPVPESDPVAPVAATDPLPPPIPLFFSDKGGVVTLQHGRLTTLHALPAPQNLSLDADLASWDRRAWFRSAWAPPYDSHYYVEGGIVFDADNLFVGAHVGDPWPMKNSGKTAEKPDESVAGAWDGGSLQLRFLADLDLDTKKPNPEPRHLTLWYSKETGHLHVQNQAGMTKGTPRAHLPASHRDFDVRFKEDPDGRGYTFRARISWNAVGFKDPPYGRAIPFCWEVVWADPARPAGHQWVGKWTEFLQPKKVRARLPSNPGLGLLPGRWATDPSIWGTLQMPKKES